VVGPSITPEERSVASLRLKLGFVLLVSLSAGLVALQARGSAVQIAVALAAGLAIGGALLWFLQRWGREFMRSG
jgi:lysozyme family protein